MNFHASLVITVLLYFHKRTQGVGSHVIWLFNEKHCNFTPVMYIIIGTLVAGVEVAPRPQISGKKAKGLSHSTRTPGSASPY